MASSDTNDDTSVRALTADHALQLLASALPDTAVELIRPLSGGKSGAQVLLVDLTNKTHTLDGQFVAKVQRARSGLQNPNEPFRQLGVYTKSHTPDIVHTSYQGDISIEVYDLAGFSTDTTRTLREIRGQSDRHKVLANLVEGLLGDQLDQNARQATYKLTATSVLEQWLGANFWDDDRYSTLLSMSSLDNHDSEVVFRFAAELLPNPVRVIAQLALIEMPKVGTIAGLNHGDLHTANILVQGSTIKRRIDHWIIDANWDTRSPLFYDFAYLEVSLILDSLSAANHLEMISLLRALNDIHDYGALDVNHTDLVSNLRTIRDTVLGFLSSNQERRSDVWRLQVLLAQIAAGLNWSTKPIEPNQRTVALIYAAWSTREWLDRYFADFWQAIATAPHGELLAVNDDPTQSDGLDDRLKRYWEILQSIPVDTDLIIIAGRVRNLSEKVETLATLRVATVIDLDPESDENGLHAALGAYLSVSRRLNIYGSNEHLVDRSRSTNWLMANGWATRSEPSSEGLASWRRNGFLARVRRTIDFTVSASTSRSAYVLVIRDESTRDISLRILEYIDEAYSGIAEQLELAASPTAPDSVHRFVDARENARISDVPSASVSLPGTANRVEIDVVTLHRFEADLELIHDQILTRPRTAASAPLVDEFWRGRPPTWDELASGVDIRRQVEAEVIAKCRAAVKDNRSTILELDHSPGAGATTLIRRVAWELAPEVPVALVSNFSHDTGEMVAELSKLTGMPMLVFAESAHLSESDRDALFDGVASNHGRAVIVWVNRTTRPSSRAIKLIDPMPKDESADFIKSYIAMSSDDNAKRELKRLIDEYASVPTQCHSPFYYGLTAFERDFQGIDDFVKNHLAPLGPLQLKIAQYLALVTRYSQVGLYPEIVRRWLGKAERPPHEITDDYLVDTLGADLRHLVVSNGFAYRLLHPIVAEGVLNHFDSRHGGLSLAQVSVRLIEQVHEVLGESSEPALALLRNIFITRAGEFRRDGFSELVSGFGPEEGQLVFEKLTEKFPRESHFWNHRGRFHIYRVRGDHKTAEEYLERAVEFASPMTRGTHLHTLGMVRRLWVERQIVDLAVGDEGTNGLALIDLLRPTYDAAMKAFHDSRMLGSGSNYSWVTPIQLTNTVVEFLIKRSGVSNLHELLEIDSSVNDWVSEQMHQSESLLEVVRIESLERVQSRDFYTELTGKIDALYGDIDTLVEQWKAYRESGHGDPVRLGCSMARAVFSSAGRSWANVDESRARELADMLQPAVDSGAASDVDLRTWIQAYRRLPEYSSSTALERVTYYASERNSIDGAYYSFILCFQLWSNGGLVDQDRVRHYLDLCKRLSRNQRQDWSYEWVSADGHADIVHFSELGRWTRDRKQVWSDPKRLGRVRGVIEDVDGYRSGFARVGSGTLQAFFSPQGEILSSRDVNQVADFYLGFSYTGLRAWSLAVTTEAPDVVRSAVNLPYSANFMSPKSILRMKNTTTEANEATAEQVAVGDTVEPDLPAEVYSTSPLDTEFRDYLLALCDEGPDGVLRADLSGIGDLLVEHFGIDRYRRFKAGSKNLHASLLRIGLSLSATSTGYELSGPSSY